MKAMVVTAFGPSESLQCQEWDVPSIQSNEVLIRVQATSVNYADIKARYGYYHGGGTPPFIPGLDAAGVVEAIGTDVRGLSVGQRVIAFPKSGSYAEYAVANAAVTFPLPDGIDWETAAACPTVALTAYKLLADVARLVPGETVVVHAAAGGVGTTAIQLAKILGAGCVIGTVGSERKKQTALDAGADYVFSYEGEDFSAEVNRLTDGRGADVILDSIAGEVSAKSLDCLALYGRLVNFGNASGSVGRFETKDVHSSCRSVLGFSLGTTRKERPELLKNAADAVLGYLVQGKLNMNIGRRFSLEQAAEAQEWVESRNSTGKVILTL